MSEKVLIEAEDKETFPLHERMREFANNVRNLSAETVKPEHAAEVIAITAFAVGMVAADEYKTISAPTSSEIETGIPLLKTIIAEAAPWATGLKLASSTRNEEKGLEVSTFVGPKAADALDFLANYAEEHNIDLPAL